VGLCVYFVDRSASVSLDRGIDPPSLLVAVTNVIRLAVLQDDPMAEEEYPREINESQVDSEPEGEATDDGKLEKATQQQIQRACVLLRDPSQSVRCWGEKVRLNKVQFLSLSLSLWRSVCHHLSASCLCGCFGGYFSLSRC
jgi:hypothetical protein